MSLRIPDIRRHPNEWFNYFDRNRSGCLDKEELKGAFIETFKSSVNPYDLRDIIDALWPIFDRDGSGNIEIKEFMGKFDANNVS